MKKYVEKPREGAGRYVVSFILPIIAMIIWGIAGYQWGIGNKVANLHPNGQALATTCYVNEQTRRIGVPEYDGYFYNSGEKTMCNKKDESNSEIKVEFKVATNDSGWDALKTLWIPKEYFYPYYTLKELSEKVNEREKK